MVDLHRWSWLLVGAIVAAPASARQEPPVEPEAGRAAIPVEEVADEAGGNRDRSATGTPAADRFADPFEAYAAGSYDQALEGFLDDQIEHPEDPVVALNVGSAHYEMRNYGEADRAFSTAALSADSAVRQKALYNLGNSAYRQGRLQEAVEHYKSALELDPDDLDAKFNLEFVRDEIRRRHEEAQKRQQEQQQQQQQPQQEQGEDQEQPGEQGEPQSEEQEPQQEEAGSEESQQQQSPDSDGDGLPDEVETGGENPTDPTNPDSDGDGLPDGAEDLNRNGRVDEPETDPNRADSDGDGIPDGREAEAGQPGAEQADGTATELTPEEAERYLQALEEGRPDRRQAGRGRQRPTDKDW